MNETVSINQAAPVVSRGRVHIAASPEVVWDVMSDVAAWPTWNPDVKAARLDGPLAPGSTFRWRAGPGEITSTIRRVRPGEVIEWTGRSFGVRAVHVWRVIPDSQGAVAETEESWEGLPARIFRRRSQQTLDRAVATGLHLVKVESERRARAKGR